MNIFFLKDFSRKEFLFPYGDFPRWGGRGFPICLCFSQGFPIYSLIFGYFPIVIGYSGIDLSAWRQTSPTHSTVKMLQVEGGLGLCIDRSYNESSHPSTGCRIVPLHPKWQIVHRLLCVRPDSTQPKIGLPSEGSRRTPASLLLIRPMPKGDGVQTHSAQEVLFI